MDSVPPETRRARGRAAELRVARVYEQRGYLLIAHGVHVGRLELDLVLRDRETLVVCEVRSVRADPYVHPAYGLVGGKRARVRRAAAAYRAAHPEYRRLALRVDAALVVGDAVEILEGAL